MTTRIQFDLSTVSVSRPRDLPHTVSVRRIAVWFRAAAARWRERRMLEEFDERMLKDIGISRSQALAEASKPFWRR
jgi:uncharacterized protein YjiS (DUF1127 family)